MTTDRLTELEDALAHLEAALADISDVVRAQGAEITRLRTHVDLLLSEAAAREKEGGSAVFTDTPPPHY